jgi:tRNA pseudouridine38-40 synthase
MRWKITLEYHGGSFVGWQRQLDGMSIQQALEEAIQKFTNETPRVTGAGRTDSGVHALGQVAHFDLVKPFTADVVRDAINAFMRDMPISVLVAEAVADDFDARFRAKRRHYRYRILNRRPPPAIEAGRVWHVVKPLDADAMHAAAQCLVGHHDFSTFRAAECQAKSPVKTVESLAITRQDDEIILSVAAPSFLHHQVRNIIGTLSLVGLGSWSAEDMEAALAARDRAKGGPTAPASGLYFVRVEY